MSLHYLEASMDNTNILNDFDKQIDNVEYKDELYSVRDNGSIKRYPKGNRKRKLDDVWTFGTEDKQHGYFAFSGIGVHRIVATAFLGPAPSDSHVVDHKDTNRKNNRPENLHWVTRLENILINPVTKEKIEFITKMDIADVLKDISVLQKFNLPPNISWMKTLTREEASHSYDQWNNYLAKVEQYKEGILNGTGKSKKQLFEEQLQKYRKEREKFYHYLLVPEKENPTLKDYFNNLQKGAVFLRRDCFDETVDYTLTDFAFSKSANEFFVCTYDPNGVKSYYLTTVTLSNGRFEYETRSFFGEDGLTKYFTLAKGEEWTGGDVFDDFC
jgi:hypothetical protein